MARSLPNDSEKIERDDLILNFRATTTIINVLQRAPLGNIRPKMESANAHWRDPATVTTQTSSANQRELLMLNALATLLVRDHEKVAIVHKGPSRRPNGELGVDFLVCVNHVVNSKDASIGGNVTVIEPKNVVIDVYKSLSYVRRTWKSQTFQDHAYAVVDLIRQCKPTPSSASTIGIVKYVIASSYRGMQRHINSKISVTFREALFSIKDFQVTSQPKHPRRIGNVQGFLEILPSTASKCDIQIPRLLRVTDLSTNPSPDDVYNNETCTEFHQTLCALLRGFQASVAKLTEFHLVHDVEVQLPRESESESPLEEAQPSQEVLESLVSEIRFYGSRLHIIAYGPIIHMHLSTIASLLGQYALNNMVRSHSEENDVDDLSNDFELSLRAEDQTKRSQCVVKTCLKGLRLMVRYFEAIYVVLKAFRSKESLDFSIKIVTVPSQRQGSEMTRWRDLVRQVFLPGSSSAEDAIDMIDELRAKHNYFESAFGDEASLSTGHGFLGGLHCVACLASIVSVPSASMFGNDLENLLLDYTEHVNLGVSQPCCPVCSVLLRIFQHKRGVEFEFEVLNVHKTVYACTLPQWLPTDILRLVLSEFKEQLKLILTSIQVSLFSAYLVPDVYDPYLRRRTEYWKSLGLFD